MKKTTLLNAPISSAIARLGHGDSLCIGDAGLPVPKGVDKIDLALTVGMPRAIDVLKAVTSEMCVERAVIAHELRDEQPEFHAELCKVLDAVSESQSKAIQIDVVSHEDFKRATMHCQTAVRTGECTPFANIILYSGVTF